jgi:hypothetical protein
MGMAAPLIKVSIALASFLYWTFFGQIALLRC